MTKRVLVDITAATEQIKNRLKNEAKHVVQEYVKAYNITHENQINESIVDCVDVGDCELHFTYSIYLDGYKHCYCDSIALDVEDFVVEEER